jgi:hypothetical protein
MSRLDGMSEHSLKRLLSDCALLEKNSFYALLMQSFLEELGYRQTDIDEGVKLEEKDLRVLQGMIIMVKRLYGRPDRMVSEIQAKLEGQSQQRPQGE